MRSESYRDNLYGRLIVPFVYASVLTALPVDVFYDRQSYFNYVTDSWFLLVANWQQGILPLVANEPVWLLLNALLGLFLSPENAVRLIVFIAAFIVSRYILLHSAYPLAIGVLVLLFPVLLRNQLCTLRNALATALFLVGWFSAVGGGRWILIALAALVHVSFFIIAALAIVCQILVRLRLGADIRQLVYVGMGILYTFAAVEVAQLIGARHGYDYAGLGRVSEASGIGFLYWSFALGLAFWEGRQFLRHHALPIAVITLHLTSYPFVDFGARAFESIIALILIDYSKLSSLRRQLFLASLVTYMIVFYITRTNEPWLGFGVK